MKIQVTVDSVRASLMSAQRLVVLKEQGSDRYLPIWIGPFEADSIAMELQELEAPRPMSHDLLKSAITTLGGRVSHVVVSDLRHDTFYAQVVLDRGGQELILDARPSDSIALAVRAGSPIFVESSVIERAGIRKQPDMRIGQRAEPETQDLEVFRDFIEELEFGDSDRTEGD